MSLNDNQILNLLNDGYASDLDIPSDDEPEDELEICLRNFENDDFVGYMETQILTEEIRLNENDIETEDELEVNDEYNIEINVNSLDTGRITQSTLEFKTIKKKKLNG